MVGRSWSVAVLLLLLLTLIGAFSCTPPPQPETATRPTSIKKDLVRRLKRSTLALIKEEGSRYTTYCAGVWLDPHIAITAYHCVEPSWIKEGSKLEPAAADEIILGSIIRFKTYAESMYSQEVGDFKDPGHLAKVIALDRKGDLALIQSHTSVDHDWVDIATEAGDDGDKVHVVGHPHSTPYVYSPGLLSAMHFKPTTFGNVGVPTYEVIGFIWYGNSGGGIFNNEGELLGIVVSIDVATPKSEKDQAELPRTGWAVHNLRIRQLLLDNNVTLTR